MRAEELAAEHIDEHLKDEFRKAFAKVQKEQHHEGCGCNTCKHAAIEAINSIAWIMTCGDPDVPKYMLDADGEIYLGFDNDDTQIYYLEDGDEE